MTHGHEKRHEDCLREWGLLGGGRQRGGNQDNYNSITNKMQFKKKKAKDTVGKNKAQNGSRKCVCVEYSLK